MANLPTKRTALLGCVILGSAAAAHAQDSGALIDVLVKKGILTDQEAVEVKTDLMREAGATSAGKVNLASSTTEFRIGGDLRVRYEYRSGENDSGDHQERNRYRYRFRAGFTGTVTNDFFYGFRLETGSGNRSSNVTMGDDGGPWAKNNDGTYIGQLYIGWKPTANWTLTAGRMANPLVTTSMVWDGDINPEGFAEQFKTTAGGVTYFANLGQFVYGTAGSQNVFGSAATNSDLFLLAWQGGAKIPFSGGMSLQVAPVLYQYANQKQSTNPTGFRGAFSPTNLTAANNLFIVEVPVEFGFSIGETASKVFADFAYNFEGKDRARKYGRADLDGENKAYQVGFQYGKAANRGDWDAKVFYQATGAFSLDPNLVDSDLFDSRTNMKGWVLQGNYALGSATQLSLTVANGKRKEGSLIATGAGDIGTTSLNKMWLGQIDLNLKF